MIEGGASSKPVLSQTLADTLKDVLFAGAFPFVIGGFLLLKLLLLLVMVGIGGLYCSSTICDFIAAYPTTLVDFQGNVPIFVRSGEVQRLLIASLLSRSMRQLAFNLLIVLYLGSRFEKRVGRALAMLFLVGCCLSTQLANAASHREQSFVFVGSLGVLMGLAGSRLGSALTRWLERQRQEEGQAIGRELFVSLLFIVLLFVGVVSSIEFFGLLSGCLFGLGFGVVSAEGGPKWLGLLGKTLLAASIGLPTLVLFI